MPSTVGIDETERFRRRSTRAPRVVAAALGCLVLAVQPRGERTQDNHRDRDRPRAASPTREQAQRGGARRARGRPSSRATAMLGPVTLNTSASR